MITYFNFDRNLDRYQCTDRGVKIDFAIPSLERHDQRIATGCVTNFASRAHERDTQSSGDDDDRGNRFFVARASRVFNVAQVDGFELPAIEPSIDRIDPCVAAEAFIASTGANITVAGERAFYNRTSDSITMPDRHRFVGTKTSTATEGWYSTLLHELTHWSGAETRCARTFGERFGDDAYAMEEMVALSGQSAPPATLQ